MAYNIDVSEVKTYNTCRRQWQFSSRNQFHIVPRTPAKSLAMGTIFHEAVAQLYLGADYDKVMTLVRKEIAKDETALIGMLKGYYEEVLIHDLEKWEVLEVEHRFKFPSGLEDTYWWCPQCKEEIDSYSVPHEETCPKCHTQLDIVTESVVDCIGSIDLIVYERKANTIYGVEHKTCSTFRDNAFLWMDEQPRVYCKALDYYIGQAKEQGRVPKDAINGGIYINEVKKLLRDFQYKRTLCTYDKEDLDRFWNKYLLNLESCVVSLKFKEDSEEPCPNYMNCRMCGFQNVCAVYGYRCVSEKVLLEDFGTEYMKRDCDHLDEKLDFGKKLEEN